MNDLPLVLLTQLPIPPPGPMPVEGNVPLAAAYLKLFARRQGLEQFYRIELQPTSEANALGDRGLVEAIVARRPWMVGFSCYVWNVERTLWVARQLKSRRPDLLVVVGGPEITRDNAWIFQQAAIDYAVVGEGEAAFAQLLAAYANPNDSNSRLPYADESKGAEGNGDADKKARLAILASQTPLPTLDVVSSPYLEGILDVADGRRLMLETVRGCRFRCKYCYYPKNFDAARFLSEDQIRANLRHAIEHGADEVVLLDPTLNQRRDFQGFLQMLADNNPGRQLAFSGELRAEGIDRETARLLRAANFHEIEIGLQSVEPRAWELMGRPVNLAAFQSGVQALLDEGVKVCVDLILGLPGDTADSFRRGIEFLQKTRAYSEVQVFNLSILPGTAFRQEAAVLGLSHQPWPPYYVLKTPTLNVEQMYELMAEAQDAFGIEFDPPPPPSIQEDGASCFPEQRCCIHLDEPHTGDFAKLLPDLPAQCFTLWLRSANFQAKRKEAVALVERLLNDNPHTTLQVILEPTGDPRCLTADTLESLLAACYRNATYLDRYYSLHPGPLLGAKRLFVLPPAGYSESANDDWLEEIADCAVILD